MALKSPWPICKTCQAIPLAYFQNEEVNQPYRAWPTFADFADSASRGCHTCTLLYEAVREPFKTRLDDEPIYLESAKTRVNDERVVVLTVDPTTIADRTNWNGFLQKPNDNDPPNLQFLPIADVKYVRDARDVPQDARHFKDLISLYAEDDGVFRYIRQALTNCLSNHSSTCDRVMFPLSGTASRRDNVVNIIHGHRGLVVAPTRLIYVGSENPKDVPRLVDGQECLRNGGYIVLSYCWGINPKTAPWHLKETTMKLFTSEIPLDILPQTLHDAIMWTRKLGERYIWIDGLCILQDSEEDWQREASRMASIYGSGTVTLVAASSSVYGGMSDRRNPLRSSAASLCLRSGSEESTIYLLPNGQPRNTPRPAPTDSRGWCYQEDLLSSRLVKMTQNSVVWQCVGDGSNPATRAQGLEQLRKHPPFRWYTLWYRLIERYSNKSLTNHTDKLLAFYGIACDKAGSNYLAGFLKSDPWVSLLWCRDENQIRRRPGRRYEKYVAPSWSWASLDAPVLFYEANARHWRKPQLEPSPMDPELHHAEVEKAFFFDTGAVKGGSVEMSAYVVTARTATVEPFLFNTRHGFHTYGRRNCVDPRTGEALGLVVFDVATEAADDMTLCCALLQTADLGLWTKNGTAGLGLALSIEATTSERLECRRVGYVQLTSAFGVRCSKRRLKLT
ncbi:uncharacterized protein PV09_05454 [Verruconis gallopava]|uniref:Heterokaryon incompatibility domain-containing protein n=1 Tax=Verruconis gallopava TaxID=253628 RepID=A0A0D1YRI4_9PEZI|nr:uncharacterized protein PV09_05454 [Verruconis gallopava]KIW03232.1 hypothetical protein PV09_05454 [Verruconis gallopava]